MATTSPDNLYSPDAGTTYNIPVATAAMQDSVQAALTNLRSQVPSLTPYRTGTNTQRLALTGMAAGLKFWATDTKLEWVYDGAKWLLTPGQLLGSMESTSSPTSANALIGTVITVSGLSVGQRVRVISAPVGVSLASGGSVTVWTAVRNNATAVTATTNDKSVASRTYAPPGNLVSSIPGVAFVFTTTSTANLTAGIFNGNGQVFGADGQRLMIVSA